LGVVVSCYWLDEERDINDLVQMEWPLQSAQRFLERLRVAIEALTDLVAVCGSEIAREQIRAGIQSLLAVEIGLRVGIEMAASRPLGEQRLDEGEDEEA
jgi:hypothetical protein